MTTSPEAGWNSHLPSEATVENLANHAIMTGLRAEGLRAWIVKPTTREEKELGFDGMVNAAWKRGLSTAYIQYKRLASRGDSEPPDWLIDVKRRPSRTSRNAWGRQRACSTRFPEPRHMTR